MSYKIGRHLGFQGTSYEQDDAPAPAYLPASYQTYPIALGQALAPPAPLPPPGFSLARINVRQVVIGIVVIIVVALILRQLMKLAKGTQKLERNEVVARVSTKELATRLYERLDKKGRANPATMRSLERLGR